MDGGRQRAKLEVRVTDEWTALAESATDDELREKILTGFKDGKPFTPYVPTLTLPFPLARVLDFGCGLGRNFPYLKTVASHVTGFDLAAMIARCRAAGAGGADALSDDWDALRNARFDLIFASLVLQHVEADRCRLALADFARMAPVTYLITRGQGDFGFNVLDLVAASGLFDTGDPVAVDHDERTHQLRVLGRTPLESARAPDDPRHFELLLRSRIWR
jgi:SAM-dependent methyltransferase